MVGAPEANVTLDAADVQKLELAGNRLKVVQEEVLKATKEVASLEVEMNEARKTKEYAVEEKSAVEKEVFTLRAEKEALEESVSSLKKTLKEHEDEHEAHRVYHTSMQTNLDTRSEEIQKGEDSLSKRTNEHTIKETKLEEDRAQVEYARETLKHVLESIEL